MLRPARVLVMLLLALSVVPASAVALATGKITDASVCDLAPGTTELIAGRTFLPADAPFEQLSEAFFRLGAEFVRDSCKDGQVLILQSRYGSQLDEAVLSRLANSSCIVAGVSRTASTSRSSGGDVQQGFELHCRIEKLSELKEELARLEAEQPLTNLLARIQAPRPRARVEGSPPKRDCSKLTLSSVLLGGPGSCQ